MTRKLELIEGNSRVVRKTPFYTEENINGWLSFACFPLSDVISDSLDYFLKGLEDEEFDYAPNYYYKIDDQGGLLLCPSVSLAKGWIELMHENVKWWTPLPDRDDDSPEDLTYSILPRIVNIRIIQIYKFLFHCNGLYKRSLYEESFKMIHPCFCRELMFDKDLRKRLDSYLIKPDLNEVFYMDYNDPFNFLHESTFDMNNKELTIGQTGNEPV